MYNIHAWLVTAVVLGIIAWVATFLLESATHRALQNDALQYTAGDDRQRVHIERSLLDILLIIGVGACTIMLPGILALECFIYYLVFWFPELVSIINQLHRDSLLLVEHSVVRQSLQYRHYKRKLTVAYYLEILARLITAMTVFVAIAHLFH